MKIIRSLGAFAALLLLLLLVPSCSAPLLVQVDGAAAPEVYARGAVAADHRLASEAGLEMLQRGGNAVDAAVATGFCLSVVRPYSCGIGGGGFMIIHLPDDPRHGAVTVALDYRERTPAAVGPDHFESLPQDSSRFSGHAVAIPGTVAGLLWALEHYGTLERRIVLEPAIRAAEDGFLVDRDLFDSIELLAAHLDARATAEGAVARGDAWLRQRFLSNRPPVIGSRVRLPEQADALRRIAADGPAAFYDGPIGRAVVETVRDAGGLMTMDDLAGYRVTVTQPLERSIFNRRFLVMPLPSSGGITQLQMLSFLEHHEEDLETMALNSPSYIHLLTEAMKHAFADRAAWLGDPEYVEDPTARLLDPAYLDDRARRFDRHRTLAPDAYGSAATVPADGGTSHFSVVDRFGGAVACTETINLQFGARLAVADFGFCLNNEMDDFLTRRGQPNAFGLQQSERNLPAPGKRPLSSMSPTIVLDERGHVQIVAGASGGPRIISGTTQAVLDVLLFDLPASRAVARPRFHHQWAPDILYLEPKLTEAGATKTDLVQALESRGHQLGTRDAIGVVQLIRRVRNGWQAASDPRKGGSAAGY